MVPRSHSETDQQTAKINAPETPFVLLHANAAIAAAGNSARPHGQSSHRRNGHPGEPLRVDEKALRDPGQSEQEVANAERPSGKSGPHAALSDREEIQRAKRDGQKHRHREWWQSENRQSAEAECTECEDDT